MKNLLNATILLFIIVTTSCSTKENDAVLPEINNNDTTLTTYLTDQSDWSDIPIHLINASASNSLLSCSLNGDKVDFWKEDDQSGRQQWMLKKIANGIYHITVFSGVSTAKIFLGVNNESTILSLYSKDDASGNKQWELEELDADTYLIKRATENETKVLTRNEDGTLSLEEPIALSPKQIWHIESASTFEFETITYSLSQNDGIIPLQDVTSTITYANQTPDPIRGPIQFIDNCYESSRFTQTNGIKIASQDTIIVTIPQIDNNTIATENYGIKWPLLPSYSKLYNFGTYEYNVPAQKTFSYTRKLHVNKLSANYEAIYRNSVTSALKKTTGKWEGNQVSQIEITVNEINQ